MLCDVRYKSHKKKYRIVLQIIQNIRISGFSATFALLLLHFQNVPPHQNYGVCRRSGNTLDWYSGCNWIES
jgi:hypothetical protein